MEIDLLSNMLANKESDIEKTSEYNYYKERSALDTVRIIGDKLYELGFDMVESGEESGVGTYSQSLKLFIRGSSTEVAFSYGKGNTPEFARASAFAEMIERLQCDPNRVYRQFYACYNKEKLGLTDYVVYPDEKKETDIDKHKKTDIICGEVYKLDDDKARKQVDKYVGAQYKSYGYIPLARFTDAKTKEDVYLNEMFVRANIVGSTGFCAGNTKYESLIQGLSEIIERYAKFQVFKNRLCLPIIEESYLEKYRYAYNVITRINKTGRYSIEVRDASFGGKLPVVAVILYDKVRRGYVVNLGSFPVFEIALERAINEVLQGQDIRDMRTVIPYISLELDRKIMSGELSKDYGVSEDLGEVIYFMNYLGSNCTNEALYPDEFTTRKFDYEFTAWGGDYNRTNEEMFYTMCNTVESVIGDKVLYKDYSFLGFPSYSIICPKITISTQYPLKGHYLNNEFDSGELVEAIYSEDKIDTDKIVSIMQEESGNASLSMLTGRHSRYENIGEKLVKGLAEFHKKNYTNASELFHASTPTRGNIKVESGEERDYIVDTWVCLYNFVSLMNSVGDSEEDMDMIAESLGKIYSNEVVKHIRHACNSSQNLAQAFFKDYESALCVVDWDKEYATRSAFKIIQDMK